MDWPSVESPAETTTQGAETRRQGAFVLGFQQAHAPPQWKQQAVQTNKQAQTTRLQSIEIKNAKQETNQKQSRAGCVM